MAYNLVRQDCKTAAIRTADIASFGDDFTGDNVVWWAVVDPKSGVVLAFCGVDLQSGEDAAFLCRAWISERLRGKGLHKRMVRVRERFARTHGYTRAITYTAEGNCKSANTLIGCGYRTYTPTHD